GGEGGGRSGFGGWGGGGRGGAEEANGRAGGPPEANMVQDFLAIDTIAKRNVIEFDTPADRRKPCASGRIGRLRGRVEDVAQPRDRQPRLVEILPKLGEPQYRRAHPSSQKIEGDEFADGEVAVDHEPGAAIQDARRNDLVDQLD